MHTKGPKEDPLVELGYEPRDVNYKVISRAVIGFFIFTAIAFGAGLLIFNAMNPEENRRTRESMAKAEATRRMPGENAPLLQNNVTAKSDMMTMRKEEEARLNGTGYLDASQTRVHIPVERALEILAERGAEPTGAEVPAVTRGNTTDQIPDAAHGSAPETGAPAHSPAPTPPQGN